MNQQATRAVEQAARESYAKLLAFLARRSGDLAAAEDALGDAFLSALLTWPERGIPAKPEAWLATAAQRRLIDRARRRGVEAEAMAELIATARQETEEPFSDERLRLLFVCAHPEIPESVRAPLMLQVVLGLDAVRIGSAFLVRPSAMGQRLSRAKSKIREAGLSFELPNSEELAERLDDVLQAIYAAYGSGWDDVAGAGPRQRNLTFEALEIGRTLVSLMPNEPEAKGLLALMLYCEARREARRDASGVYVPLSEQDPARWSHAMIEEAERMLGQAAQAGRMGRFQLEAAIQSVHILRGATEQTDWETIALLYEGLVRVAPTWRARVGRAAAIAEARGPAEGWAALQELRGEVVVDYQSYWALGASLLSRLNRNEEAAEAYGRAIGLSSDPAARQFLMQRLSCLKNESR